MPSDLRSRTISRYFISAAIITMATVSMTAKAQDRHGNGMGVERNETDTNDSTIIVTGTRIQSPNISSPLTITSIDIADLVGTGHVSLGDALNELPALRSSIGQGNSTRFLGTAGLNLLDLRGLGSERTLTLVNGRRHVTASPGDFRVDVNTIPTDLVERVDIVTGGNSAIYGADAVAGVVNFVLKRDFEGIRFRAQTGISGAGDRPTTFGSLTLGQNFAGGRGNVAIALEYADSDPLFNTQRDNITGAFSGRNQFEIVEDRTGELSTGNGIPDRNFLRGVRNNNISDGGLYGSFCPAAVAMGDADFAEVSRRRAVNCTGLFAPGPSGSAGPTGPELGRTFVFNNDGRLIANPITTDLRPFGSNNAVGGLGSTLNNTGLLLAGLERYAINFLASYKVSEAFRPFIEAKYVRIDALQEGQATFFSNRFSLNNPFLNAEDRALLISSRPDGTATFNAVRLDTDFGARGEEHRRETYRIVAGIDGIFNDDWKYELAFNYGRLDTFYRTNGNILIGRFFNSINAVRNGNGDIVCAINADASTANDDPACAPANLFGSGNVSQAARDYFGYSSTRDEKAQQYGVTAYFTGNSSQLFELPGGPAGFVIGGEYRRDSASAAFDPVTASGATYLNAIPDFDPPAAEVWEAYGEVNFPILTDVPFAEELSLQAAGRVSDYNSTVGTVFAYNLSGSYAPVRSFRFHVGYAESVRAPTLSDQFASGSQTFANSFQDPCSSANIANNPNRAANCLADPNVPTFNPDGVTPFTNIPGSGLLGSNAGHPDIREENSQSLTIGAVFQPSFVPGLTLAVDYYDITVKNVIITLPGQTLINQCYDNPGGIINPFCDAISRRPDGTFAGQSSRFVNGQLIRLPLTGPSFRARPFNFARLETSGVDFDLNYATQIFSGVQLDTRLLLNYLINRTQFTDISRPDFADRQKSELGDPAWASTFRLGLDFGDFDFAYELRYIGKQTIAPDYEDQNPFNGEPARDPDAYPQVFYPDVFYHDIRMGFDVSEKFRFYGGVDNVFDRLLPFGLDGTGQGDGIFNSTGRFFYAGVEVNF